MLINPEIDKVLSLLATDKLIKDIISTGWEDKLQRIETHPYTSVGVS